MFRRARSSSGKSRLKISTYLRTRVRAPIDFSGLAQELGNPSDVFQIIMNVPVDQIDLRPKGGHFDRLVWDRII